MEAQKVQEHKSYSQESCAVHLAERPVERRTALCREFGGHTLLEIVWHDTARSCGFDSEPISADRASILLLNLEGTRTLPHETGELRLRPGDLLYVPAGLSLRWLDHLPGQRIVLGAPQTALPPAALPCLIDGNDAIAAVLRQLLCTLLRNANPFYEGEQRAVQDSVVQLLAAACLARQPRPTRRAPVRATSVRQWRLLQQSVEALLSDPSLTPAMVATSHGISTRHLHRLFRQKGVSFGTYVRMRRLQHCREDLADPDLGALRLTEIAYRWGFSDSAHFSRCFKAAFGCTAREFRTRGLLRTGARNPFWSPRSIKAARGAAEDI
jgi:AraC-like DNA-binding protein